MKRIFDISLSCLILLFASPLIVFTYILVIICMGKPAIFKQLRPGYLGKVFNIYKFRTMLNTTDVNGNLLPNEERRHPIGNFIRKTSLDELPQLINVVKGDISLVGPRPLLMDYLPLYNEFQRKRMNVKPGITGWAQINGRNAISWEKKFELDVWYVENQSLKLDLFILYKTVVNVMKRKDIYSKDNKPVEKFTGTTK
ncbi:sugar transferase [Staphylococcus xylosus]|uniref:sugar transferase n=1 Tax=Staphylococcus xylosus TaxID=1288 RepID=UPI002DBA3BF5|nr:sugar transferase [Staphylococcus xylosus]MEB8121487.1 sugar transferase [Staphylococcus xylosus]